jgi:signal transduction histidine kinase
MRLLSSLHGRLTLAYSAATLAALLVFAAGSGFFLLQLSANVLDTRLRTTASALTVLASDAGPRLQLTPADKLDFLRVVKQLDAALFRPDGTLVFTSAVSLPPQIVSLARSRSGGMPIYQVHTSDDLVRVAVESVTSSHQRLGMVVVWASADSLQDFQRDMLLVFGLGIPAIVALAALGAWFVTRRGLTPLRAIAHLARDIEAHDLSRRLKPESQDDELGRLSATFDRMLDRLEGAFDRQRRFTADASHELRAPLSVIRAEADLALRRERASSEYREALESIASEAERIEELVSDLLALARAEADRNGPIVPVNLTTLVVEAVHRLEPIARSRDVSIRADLCSNAYVMGEVTELAHLPLAVIHNAVKYAKAAGTISVALAAHEGELRLVVRDDGNGFSPEALRRATERFWRDDGARDRTGSGLGLAIVRAIAERVGGHVDLRNAPGGGAQVTVSFPQVQPASVDVLPASAGDPSAAAARPAAPTS